MSIRNKILIITERDDLHASEVISLLNQQGKGDLVFRLSIEDFQENTTAVFDGYNYHILIKDSGRRFSTNEIGVVWFRKPRKPFIAEDDEGVRTFIQKEFKSFIQGLYCTLKDVAFWINDREKSLSACNKMYQLRVAKEVGFSMPDTVITNDSEIAIDFCKKHETVCNKGMSTPDFIMKGVPYLYCTRKTVCKELMEHKDSIECCPALFQQLIEKSVDIRVTIIGKKIFACEIHSQELRETETDFRLVDPRKLTHLEHALPEDVLRMIESFMDRMGLQFSAMDLVLDKEGRYWFLENNCNGQWLWIEYLTGIPLIDSMANLLTDPDRYRR